MIGNQERWQEDLFVAGPLSSLIPDDHILKRVDKVLDLSWFRREVADCYNANMGRPSIDPESALRLMLAGYFQGIVHDRKLMREAQVNLAIRWFAGFRLDETLPEHSSLTKIRQRWGQQRFRMIFQKTVQMCIDAGLVNGETVHIDSTLIRADVSWESLTTEYADKSFRENCIEEENNNQVSRTGKPKKRSTTDPEATLTTSSCNSRMEPSFKQHTAVDDHSGVILDVKTTTGEVSEGKELLEQISRIEEVTEKKVKTVTADMAYAHTENYSRLEQRNIEAVIPVQPSNVNPKSIPINRFKYDSRNEIVRCPGGKILRRSSRTDKGWGYHARRKDCAGCPLRARCVTATAGRLGFTQDLNDDGDTADANEAITYGFSTATDATADGIADTGSANLGRNTGTATGVGGSGFQPISENFQAIEFNYLMADGTFTSAPAATALNDIRGIRISLLARAAQADTKFANTMTYTSASGAAWGSPYNDQFRRRLMITTIQCRNLGL